MKLLEKSARRRPCGYVLIVVILSMAVLLIVFAGILNWTTSNATVTRRNNLFNVTENAAESATENILTTMMRDFNYQYLQPVSSYNTLLPPTNGWPVYFQFTDTNGNTAYTASVTNITAGYTNLTGAYARLYGWVQQCQIAVTATPKGQGDVLSASVSQSVQFTQIPLFQFGTFYNLDMEINPTTIMGIGGTVWCNGNIYTSPTGTLVYFLPVSATGNVYYTRDPNDSTPNGSAANVIYSQAFTTNTGPVVNCDTLTMPVGGSTNNSSTNVYAILQPPPAAAAPPNYAAAYSATGMVYMANAADLIISNTASGTNGTFGTNITVYYQNQNEPASYITKLPGDVMVVSNASGVVYDYSFVTNASYYDYREGRTVQAVQIDVGALNNWLSNSNPAVGGAQYNLLNTTGSTTKNHTVNSIYVYNNVSMANNRLPAVRVVNATVLPSGGLTVATPQPLYVVGDYNIMTNYNASSTNQSRDPYNSTYTYPSALMCDAITVLSTNWQDSYTANTPLNSRTVGANVQTINAALLTGIVPSTNGYYSGGLENLIRLQENWGSGNIVNTGSQCVMFASQFGTNRWQAPGIYYKSGGIDWAFNNNFYNYAQLPPLTPRFSATIRGGWQAW